MKAWPGALYLKFPWPTLRATELQAPFNESIERKMADQFFTSLPKNNNLWRHVKDLGLPSLAIYGVNLVPEHIFAPLYLNSATNQRHHHVRFQSAGKIIQWRYVCY